MTTFADLDTQLNNEALEDVDPIGSSWGDRDLSPIVAGLLDGSITRPEPTVGRRDDGVALLYPGRTNGLNGESGAGKSMLVQAVAAQEIEDGHHVVYVDLEDDETGTAGRLLDLGLPPDAILGRFHYVRPDECYGLVAAENLLALIDAVVPTLVVIDSTGEALSINGVKDQDDEIARWFRLLPRPIANRGPAVVTVDHVTKAKDGRGLYAIGSQRKRAAITGSSFMVEPIKAMGKGAAGAAKLITAKDRCGTHKTGSVAAIFHLDATKTPTVASLTASTTAASDGDDWVPTHLMEKISRHLELNPDRSKNEIERSISGKTDFVRQALAELVQRGYVVAEKAGQATRHSVVRVYRETLGNDDEMGCS
jgi:hypothetical protein